MYMLHSAHIFIGKEFVPVVESIGDILKTQNPESLSFVHFYCVSGGKKGSLTFKNLEVEELQKNGTIEIMWSEEKTITPDKLSDFWSNQIFDKILNVSNTTQEHMNVFMHFMMYQDDQIDTVKQLCSIINTSMRPVNVDFVGYHDDMQRYIEPEFKTKTAITAERLKSSIKLMYEELNYTPNQNHLVVIQNRTLKGVSILTEEDGSKPFYEMVAQLALLFSSHYDSVFPSTVSARDVVGIGFSSLYFDKYLFANYLLEKTMLSAIDSHSVNNSDVDFNKTSQISADILKDKETILSRFLSRWESKVKDNPKYVEIKEEVDEIMVLSMRYFAQERDMTAKAALLASLLSLTDCELFSNTIYNPNSTCFEDLYIESINYYIDEDDVEYYKMGDEKPINPLKELKDINRKLIQSEVTIRSLKEQISNYENQIEKSEKVKECLVDDGVVTFDDKKFRLLPEFNEAPLTDAYEEHQVTATSIDLRGNFRPIQNQGQQGSCLSFALTSIFEYMMKATGQKEYDLSEAFLYYNARDLDGDGKTNEDNGSRFHPSIESLMKYGLALEKVWPYNDGVYSLKPSQEAYDDAATRKLVKALNVRLSSDAIKSALQDGYPVVGSFVLYPSFYNAGGYIPVPTIEEIAESKKTAEDSEKKDRHGHHAMVIVGFSDQLKMFLVRNSWGEDWGEKGYCYIPYEYIDNPELFQFACLFSEIASLDFKKPELKEIPSLKVNNQDLHIRYYIAEAALSNEEELCAQMRNRRTFLMEYFEIQKKLYSNSNSRDEFVQENIAKLEETNTLLKEDNMALEKRKEEIFEIFKARRKSQIIKAIIFGVITILLLFGWNFLFGYLSENDYISITYFERFKLSYLWLLPVWSVYLAFAWFKFKKYWEEWREERDALQLKINTNNKTIKSNETRIKLFRHKAVSAWMTLTSLDSLQDRLQQMYTKIISLINNLRIWYKETQSSEASFDFSSTYPSVSILDKDKVDKYYQENLQERIVGYIDLCDDIDNHDISPEYLSKYKDGLKNKLKGLLLGSLERINFDISAHVAEDLHNDLARSVDAELLAEWNAQAQVPIHVQSTERAVVPTDDNVLAPNVNVWGPKVSRKIGSIASSVIGSEDSYRMTLVHTAALSFDECVALRQPTPSKKGK